MKPGFLVNHNIAIRIKMTRVIISWELDQKRNSDIEKWSAIQAFYHPKHNNICPDLHSGGVCQI